MSIKLDLEMALKDALRSGDDLRKRTLRMALSAIRFIEKERGVQLEDAVVMGVLQKEVKARHESIADARRASRPDLEAENQAEIEVLLAFLPKPFTEVELEKLATEAIAEVRAVGLNEIGKVMKVLSPRLEGRATGEQASQMVRKLLTP